MILGYFFDKLLQLRISIRNSISQVDFCIRFFKVIFELKLESFLFEPISAISFDQTNVECFLLRPFLLEWLTLRAIFRFNLKNVRFHTFIVQSFRFSNIANIKLSGSNKIFIADFKVVPISMSFGIRVTSEIQIILMWLYFDGHLQISTLKRWVKRELFLSYCLGYLLTEI